MYSIEIYVPLTFLFYEQYIVILTGQSVIHVEAIELDLLQVKAAVDEDSVKKKYQHCSINFTRHR